MKAHRYALLIVDSSGQPGRRLHVTQRQIVVGLSVLGLSALVTIATLGHGLARLGPAHQSTALANENEALRELLSALASKQSQLQTWGRRAERTHAQLRAKSGLGFDERMLGMGPLEPSTNGQVDQEELHPAGSRVLSLEPEVLPLELDRIQQDADAVMASLEETLEYFHDAERLLSNTPSIRPVRMTWQTSSFGRRRDPMERSRWVMHKGIDLGGFMGAEVSAPADGVVIYAGRRGGYGMTVVIDHGFGLQTHYAHLNAFRVQVGDHVRRGQVVAEMGSTGKSTGPHLHYEVRALGQPLDPERFILD